MREQHYKCNFAKIETVSIAQKEGQLFWLKIFFQVEENYVDLLRWRVVIWIAMKGTINVEKDFHNLSERKELIL